MIQLSNLTNYEHPNIYVHKNKLVKSISEMKSLLRQQYKTKVVQIPPYVLKAEIKKANSKLNAVYTRIQQAEQTSFAFGNPMKPTQR